KPKSNGGRMVATKTVVHVPDLAAQPAQRRWCCRSSAVLLAIWSRYLRPCWRTLSAFATPILALSISGMARRCTYLHRIIRHLLSPRFASIHRSVPIRKLLAAWSCTKQRFTRPAWQHSRATLTAAIRVSLLLLNLGARGRFWLSLC